MKYRIGQKVVYIGPDFSGDARARKFGITVPIPKQTYTIRGGQFVVCSGIDTAAYLLEEIVNPEFHCVCKGGTCEVHIEEAWLRPLTDISVFERLRKEIEAGGDFNLVRDEVKA